MGKGKKKAEKTTETLGNEAKSEYDVNQAANLARQQALDAANAASRAELAGLYRGIGSGGGMTHGQVDTGRLGNVYDSAMAFGETGGYSPEREASIMENVAGLKEMGRTGGLDAEAANRFRAKGTYDEFNETGGYTDADKSRIRQVSLAPIAGYASQTADELNRRQAVQGGYGPGFDSAARALRRDAAKGMYEAGLASEMNVKNAVNEGRQWGAKGMTDSENQFQTLKTGNQYKGLMGAADVETQLQNSISQYRMMGMSLAQASAAAIADVDQFNVTNGQNMQLAGMAGLQGLYNQDFNSAEANLARAPGLLGDEYNTRAGINAQLNQARMAPGYWEQLGLQGVGAFAGAAGGALTGGIGPAMNSGRNLPGGVANPSNNRPW